MSRFEDCTIISTSPLLVVRDSEVTHLPADSLIDPSRLVAADRVRCEFDNGRIIIHGRQDGFSLLDIVWPIGSPREWLSDTLPSGINGTWMEQDGTAISRTTYSTLFALIGTTFGAGNGTTTFNLPDFRGRAPIGVGTGDATGATAHSLGAKAGEETHTLTVSETPKNIPVGNSAGSIGLGVTTSGSDDTARYGILDDTRATLAVMYANGGGVAHNVLGPSLPVHMIIRVL